MGLDLDVSQYKKQNPLSISKYQQTQEDDLRQFTEPVQSTSVIDLLQMLHTLNQRIGRFNTVLFNQGDNISIIVRFDDDRQLRQNNADNQVQLRPRSLVRRIEINERQNQIERNQNNIFARMFRRNVNRQIRNSQNRQRERQQQIQRHRQQQERRMNREERQSFQTDLRQRMEQREQQIQRQRSRINGLNRFYRHFSEQMDRIRAPQIPLNRQNRNARQRLEDSHVNLARQNQFQRHNESEQKIVVSSNIPKNKIPQELQNSTQQHGCWTNFKNKVKRAFRFGP